jgi:hypothetical protein
MLNNIKLLSQKHTNPGRKSVTPLHQVFGNTRKTITPLRQNFGNTRNLVAACSILSMIPEYALQHAADFRIIKTKKIRKSGSFSI